MKSDITIKKYDGGKRSFAKKEEKKMKKIITLALAAILALGCVFSLASCGGQELNFGKEFSAIDSQVDVLMKLNAKSIDVGVMDSIMAGYYMSQDTKYANSLMIVENLTLATEQYGIGARKGSGLTKKINQAIIDLTKEGKVGELAEKYGIASEICIDTSKTIEALTASELEDWNYLVGQGKFIVGYTDFAPISYNNGTELVGFDVELAKAVGEKIGLTPEFKLISWDAKEGLLNGKTIDCIWNGMTITDERIANMEMSIPYLNNKQVAVIRKEDKDKYKTTEDMKNAIIGAESGSAGESCVVKEEK